MHDKRVGGREGGEGGGKEGCGEEKGGEIERWRGRKEEEEVKIEAEQGRLCVFVCSYMKGVYAVHCARCKQAQCARCKQVQCARCT